MQKPSHGQLYDELRRLRKGLGISLDRIRQSPGLMALYDDPQRALDSIRATVDTLEPSPKTQALRTALALNGHKNRILSGRRIDLTAELLANIETIEGWENQAFDELATLLLATDNGPRPLQLTGRIQDGRLVAWESSDGSGAAVEASCFSQRLLACRVPAGVRSVTLALESEESLSGLWVGQSYDLLMLLSGAAAKDVDFGGGPPIFNWSEVGPDLYVALGWS